MTHHNKKKSLNLYSQLTLLRGYVRLLPQALLLIGLTILTTHLIQNNQLLLPKIQQLVPFILSFIPLIVGFFFLRCLGAL